MLRKLNLDRTTAYERLVAARLASDMLAAFLEGRPHALRLGSETGGVKGWDDLVVEHPGGLFEHHQVKRQETPFDDHPTQRTTKRGSTELQERTSLDEAFANLAAIFASPTGPPRRRYVLVLPHGSVPIKRDLEVRHVRDLCATCNNGTVTAASLQQTTDAQRKSVFTWLSTWCDFVDWPHVHAAFACLEIREVRSETDLRADIVRMLSPHYTDPLDACARLEHFLGQTASDIGAATPRMLAQALAAGHRKEVPTWSQYREGTSGWSISGVHAIGGTEIEPADRVVEAIWGRSDRFTQLRIHATPDHLPSSALAAALARLAVHADGASQVAIVGRDAWLMAVRHAVGGTLGNVQDLGILAWIEGTALEVADVRGLTNSVDEDREALRLRAAMAARLWEILCDRVAHELRTIPSEEIRIDADTIWRQWRTQLDQDSGAREGLLASLIRPTAEGDDVASTIRLGPRAADMLARALLMLLVVAVGVGGQSPNWSVLDGLGVRAIALEWWSGPARRRRVSLLEDDAEHVLGQEVAPIVVLSGVRCSASDLVKTNLAHDSGTSDGLAMPRAPRQVVTNSKAFREHLRGSVADLREFFYKVRSRGEIRERNIESIGVTKNG